MTHPNFWAKIKVWEKEEEKRWNCTEAGVRFWNFPSQARRLLMMLILLTTRWVILMLVQRCFEGYQAIETWNFNLKHARDLLHVHILPWTINPSHLISSNPLTDSKIIIIKKKIVIILIIFCCWLKKNDSGAIRFIGAKVRIKNETCVPVSDTSLGGNMWQSVDSRSGQKGSDLCWRLVAPPDDSSIYHTVSICWINLKVFFLFLLHLLLHCLHFRSVL